MIQIIWLPTSSIMALKRLLHIQMSPDSTIPSYYGSLDTRMLGAKEKRRNKRFKAENDIHICAFPKQCSTERLRKECSPLQCPFVNISPLNILTALSLKGNNSKHEYVYPLPKGNTSNCIILAKSEQNKYSLLLNICSLSLEFKAYSNPFFSLKRQELLVTLLFDSASPGHKVQQDCVSWQTNTRIYFALSFIYENRLPLSDKQGLRFHSG